MQDKEKDGCLFIYFLFFHAHSQNNDLLLGAKFQ